MMQILLIPNESRSYEQFLGGQIFTRDNLKDKIASELLGGRVFTRDNLRVGGWDSNNKCKNELGGKLITTFQ